MANEFKDIPGFEDLYQCSIVDGSILSIARWISYSDGRTVYHKERKLNPSIHDDAGNLYVNLKRNKVGHPKLVHDIVALTYPEICGTWFDGCVVHHKDGNPQNNSPYNLQVMSKREHAYEHTDNFKNLNGLKSGVTPWNKGKKSPQLRGANNGKSIPVLVYTTDFDVVGYYESASEAARALGCSSSNIISVCKGRNKTAKGFYCEYL